MKNREFEIGDVVVCVDNYSKNDFLQFNKKYTVTASNNPNSIYVKDEKGNENGGYCYRRFKLVEPKFQPEYFSALNEEEAEKYVGKVMEFADRLDLKYKKDWKKGIFIDFQGDWSPYPFIGSNNSINQLMRTCPETFQKKKVKKIHECWANIYPDGDVYYNDSETLSLKCLGSSGICVKLTSEYEVEE